MTYEDKINEFATGLINDLRTNYKDIGLPASGKWGRSLEQELQLSKFEIEKKNKNGFSLIIKGQSYTQYLENGRLRNSNQDKESIRKWVGWAGNTFLKQWVADKGLSINPFAVAYKIARLGIKVPNKFNRGGLVADVITLERINSLLKILGSEVKVNAKSEIIKSLKDGN